MKCNIQLNEEIIYRLHVRQALLIVLNEFHQIRYYMDLINIMDFGTPILVSRTRTLRIGRSARTEIDQNYRCELVDLIQHFMTVMRDVCDHAQSNISIAPPT